VADELSQYARLAAEAFLIASREDDPVKAGEHRARAYRYVDLIQAGEQKKRS